MAAILCNGLFKICNEGCKHCSDFFGVICTVPCQSLASYVGGCADLCNSPFALYLIVTVFSQGPPILFGLLELPGLPGCRGSIWLLITTILGIANIAAAFYMAIKINDRDNAEIAHLRTAFSRATYLLCYDTWMALYMLLVFGFFIWLFVGVSWLWNGTADDDGECSAYVLGHVKKSVGFGWFFVFGGFMSLSLGLCCSCCDQRDYGTINNNNLQHQQQPPPPPVNPGSVDEENPRARRQQQYYDNPPQQAKTKRSEPPSATIYTADGIPIQATNDNQFNNNGEEVIVVQAHAEPAFQPLAQSYNDGNNIDNNSQQQQQQPGNFSSSAASATTIINDIGSNFAKHVGSFFTKN